MESKPTKEEEDKGFYLNEEGLVTFTESFLLKRGYCCGNGCKHCPYNYDAVPQPMQNFLRHQREKEKNKESGKK